MGYDQPCATSDLKDRYHLKLYTTYINVKFNLRNNVTKIKLVTDISTGRLSRDLADHGFIEIYVM